MKKFRGSIFILLLFSLLLTSVSFAESIEIKLNGNRLSLPMDPVIKDGRTLVPIRPIFESLGGTVDWNNSTRTVTGRQNNKIIKLQIDNRIAELDGKDVTLDVPATILNGSTFVPVRFIGESLGAKVDWNNDTRTVNISTDVNSYTVTRVVDGDTIKVNYNGKVESVRLIGVDTPESVHPDRSKNTPQGKLASEFAKSKLEGKEVILEFDVQERDQYDRLLAYVWIDGEMFNKVLLREGYAQISTYPPNVKYVEAFTKIQNQARENNKGLWSYDK